RPEIEPLAVRREFYNACVRSVLPLTQLRAVSGAERARGPINRAAGLTRLFCGAWPTRACLTIRQVRTPSAASLQAFVSVTSQFWPLASSDEQGSLVREHHPSSIRVVSVS